MGSCDVSDPLQYQKSDETYLFRLLRPISAFFINRFEDSGPLGDQVEVLAKEDRVHPLLWRELPELVQDSLLLVQRLSPICLHPLLVLCHERELVNK